MGYLSKIFGLKYTRSKLTVFLKYLNSSIRLTLCFTIVTDGLSAPQPSEVKIEFSCYFSQQKAYTDPQPV